MKIIRSGWFQSIVVVLGMLCAFLLGMQPGTLWELGVFTLLALVFLAAFDVVRSFTHPSLWGIFFAAGVVSSYAQEFGRDLVLGPLLAWVFSLYFFVYMWLRYFRPYTNRAFEVTQG